MWWQSDVSSQIISGPRLVENWKYQLFDKEGPTASELQSLGDLTQILWTQFNAKRDELDRDYMSQEKLLLAYLASFYLPNIERSRKILTSQSISAYLSRLSSLQRITVLDFGAGPLSAFVGLLFALNETKQKTKKEEFCLKEIHVVAVERSEKAIKRGQKIVEDALTGDVKVTIQRVTSIPKDGSFNIVLASNVLNEIPERHRFNTAAMLVDSLAPSSDNFAIIIEPGQEERSKWLASTRDFLIANHSKKPLKILGPCPHEKPCPLSLQTKRDDWCWFRSQFFLPPLLNELDKKSRIEHSVLAYSFLALSRKIEPQNDLNSRQVWAVCVSDEMQVGESGDVEKRIQYFKRNLAKSLEEPTAKLIDEIAATGFKTKLCFHTGEYISGLRFRDSTETPFARGKELKDESVFQCLVKER